MHGFRANPDSAHCLSKIGDFWIWGVTTALGSLLLGEEWTNLPRSYPARGLGISGHWKRCSALGWEYSANRNIVPLGRESIHPATWKAFPLGRRRDQPPEQSFPSEYGTLANQGVIPPGRGNISSHSKSCSARRWNIWPTQGYSAWKGGISSHRKDYSARNREYIQPLKRCSARKRYIPATRKNLSLLC